MSLTEEEKHTIMLEARQNGFLAGTALGRASADSIDTLVYTDTTALDTAGVYAKEYVRAFFEAFERTFKNRTDVNDRFRYDIRVQMQRKQKEQPK